MGMVYAGTAGASFELERLELDEDRLLVSGWWFGVRGMRFVRPALIVDGRKVLATLEHKPWAAASDGSWTAAFPWTGDAPGAGVVLAVAPSVEVPLDREAAPEVSARPQPAVAVSPAPAPVAPDVGGSLRDELRALERRLGAVRDELHETRAIAAEREGRCRDLEQVAARGLRAAEDAHDGSDDLARAQAMAILDRDRASAQLEEAVADREAAVRTRKRMEAQRDEALVQRDAALARRDDAIAGRDEARRQRDELLLAHRALQHELRSGRASAPRAQPYEPRAPVAGATTLASPAVPAVPAVPVVPAAPAVPSARAGAAASFEQPGAVRIIPAARSVAAHLGRARRDSGLTTFEVWAIRIFGSVAALAFISLLVMILKAFFVF